MKIITLPQYEKTLRSPSSKFNLEEINQPKWQKFFDKLGETMFKADGVGLAAPQVNQLMRVFAINLADQPHIMINPKIIKKSFSKDILEEGCLSIPNLFGPVKRHKKIKLSYYNRQGQFIQHNFKNFIARVIQHECDHLNGILFIDKTTTPPHQIDTPQ